MRRKAIRQQITIVKYHANMSLCRVLLHFHVVITLCAREEYSNISDNLQKFHFQTSFQRYCICFLRCLYHYMFISHFPSKIIRLFISVLDFIA